MSYQFEDATPVTITGTGAKKMDNPFTEIVSQIAWKNGKDGKPIAKAFIEEHEDNAEIMKTIHGRIRRLMSEAGRALEVPGTVRIAFERVAAGTKVTFWVVKLQERPRTEKAVETAS